MALDRSTQPIVKDAGGVPIGVMQVRVGLPSIRSAGTAITGSTLIPVGNSTKETAVLDGTTQVIKSQKVYTPNVQTTSNVTILGTYTGKIDGNFIFRAIDTDTVEIYSPFGYLQTENLSSNAITSVVLKMCQNTTPTDINSGITVSITWGGPLTAGDTWILPVFSGSSYDSNQTGIVSPFSMFKGASYSIGGLRAATFTPKIDGIKKLQTGFPSYTADQIIDSVSVDISWNGYEYTNARLVALKDMMDKIINNGELPAIPVECVMRTRGGSLVTFWNPSCTINTLPSYSPQNDYSDIQFQVTGLKQTELTTDTTGTGMSTTSLAIYNAWLDSANIYSELTYPH